MRFITQDPDIETIVRRINEGEWDLQPDFQRGDVWTPLKRKRLIDSILRNWHIPPIHLVARGEALSDVLDGQQRLTAIRDFMRGGFAIDGNIEPLKPEIQELHGLRYGELPGEVARRIRRFTLRVFELTDFTPEEPHELFFRLNQPTNLTEAEKRNAFIGAPRNQVRALVEDAVDHGMTAENLGFSNARMAYDDLLARFVLSLETGTLDTKVTASRVTERYRSNEPFTDDTIALAQKTLRALLKTRVFTEPDDDVSPNKATLQTWLYFTSQLLAAGDTDELSADQVNSILAVEKGRWLRGGVDDEFLGRLLAIFQDRSTARVADVSSVLLRDVIAWVYLVADPESATRSVKADLAREFLTELKEVSPQSEADFEALLHSLTLRSDWSRQGW